MHTQEVLCTVNRVTEMKSEDKETGRIKMKGRKGKRKDDMKVKEMETRMKEGQEVKKGCGGDY